MPSLVIDGDPFTHRCMAIDDLVDRLALGLVRIGVRHGDRVGIWGPNTLEWLHTQYAVASIGAILVNINPACRPAELRQIASQAGVQTIVSASSYKTQEYYDIMAEVVPEISSATPGKIRSQELPDLQSVIMYGGEKRPGTYVMDDVMSVGSDQEAKILRECRSGTTGLPKGATLTHYNAVNSVYHLGRMLQFDKFAHTACCTVPFTHLLGCMLTSLCHVTFGVHSVVPSPGFDPEATIKAIDDERCTLIYGTPAMYVALFSHEAIARHDVSGIRTMMIGASPTPPELILQAKGIFRPEEIVTAYGITETCGVSISRPDDPEEKRIYTVGKVLPHVEVKIVDLDTREIVPLGSKGEICIRGYNVMKGYWGQKEKTREVIDPNNWYLTGDIGTLDKDGYCQIVGRSKEMINRGGVKVFPSEVEDVLVRHPKVAAAQISYYKIPTYVRFVEAYPMTASGKVQKNQLQEELKDIALD
ncbi:medium-chain acyl-CoA ligase ACSF2, mitochondrial-like [Diadema antillarum]|uniref:medium-chain acyl-CoA ligase ACSF2, mitochondrial-like n=1 Tax=Diadema antillarum TaxID=105358 RepID=UPI003A87C029